jgi:hypothetical protein
MLQLNRSIHAWRNCKPAAMVNQSDAAIEYAFEDARHDILALVDHIRKLEGQLAKKRTSVPEKVA